ncbi:NAD-dependent succinate-semialdehyde dehydrogenase [Niveispirillum sp. KHB5.9]|uniref:NAD-dependent succinate-semialdehyde dehydrogenase n=1 Tax=Niveispirillum sp. KHB5.9 TaxID=3400269 RepID=UPI003A87815C
MHYPELKLFIGGQWRGTARGEPVINPADGSILATLPHAGRQDLDDALAAAEKGFRLWRATDPAEREQVLQRAAANLLARREEIAVSLVLDQGKTIKEARNEVRVAHDRILWDAGEARRLYGRIVPAAPGMRKMVTRHPLGVVAAFTPWNYPLASPTRKVAGALAAGCSIILKGAEETPAGAIALVRAFQEAGVPDGVVNLVFGKPADISSHLIAQSGVRLVTFTGSVPVGKHLASLCGQHMKPAIMELGGNSPVIVWDDVDAELVGTLSARAKARNAGQVCVAPTRFFVHERVYDQFVDSLGAAAEALKIGTGLDPALEMGPLANERRLSAMQALTADAVGRGARLVAGGRRMGDRGFQFPLTVLADMPADARAMVEEPFGPMALVSRVTSLDEAIARANALEFGLAAYAFTDRASVATRLSEEIESGSLAINHFNSTYPDMPFGGVKDSGYGREGGAEGLEGYTFLKSVMQQAKP